MTSRITFLITALLAASVSAQQYPVKPIKIVVAFPPGAITDTTARLIATPLTSALGQPVIVENKPGASGIIGTDAALRALPDGYTLTMLSSAYTTAPALHKISFDPLGDVTPIAEISRSPFLVVTANSLPVRNMRELIALAKQNPGKLNFASAGQGTPSHFAAELFAARTGIRMHHVPYKGGSHIVTDMIGGQTDVFFSPLVTTLPQVQAGRLRGIAVTSPERSAAAPNIPTVAESGVEYEQVFWVGLAGPKGLPRPIVERLNAEVAMALKSREMAERIQSLGSSVADSTPEAFHAMIAKEIDLWRKLARQAGLQPE